MAILALQHVQLAMPAGREDEARAFYGDRLGLPETRKPANLAPRGGVWFEQGAVRIHLGIDEDFVPAKKAHPALLVDDLPRLLVKLQAGGSEVAIDEPLAGFDRAYVYDPFGNRIELMQTAKPAAPAAAPPRSKATP